MNRRFNKPAAAVRARMAQKCKDERRFGRVAPSGGVSTNLDRSNSTVAAVSSPASRQVSIAGRRRNAALAGSIQQAQPQPHLAKNPRLSVPSASSNSQMLTPPNSLPTVPQPSVLPNANSVVNNIPQPAPGVDVYSRPPVQSSSNLQSNSTNPPVVHDPPVILASAPEMTS